jgi:hypothetical protein
LKTLQGKIVFAFETNSVLIPFVALIFEAFIFGGGLLIFVGEFGRGTGFFNRLFGMSVLLRDGR